MALVFVDTSAWWAFFDRDDQWHDKARQAMEGLLRERAELVTTEDVFDELVTGLLARAGHKAAVRAGRGILASPSVMFAMVDADTFVQGWEIFQRHDRMGWSLTDCTSMAVMKRRNIPRAFSFDDDFRKMGFDVIP